MTGWLYRNHGLQLPVQLVDVGEHMLEALHRTSQFGSAAPVDRGEGERHHCYLADQGLALLLEVGLVARPCRGGRAVRCGHIGCGALRSGEARRGGAALKYILVGVAGQCCDYKVAKILAGAVEPRHFISTTFSEFVCLYFLCKHASLSTTSIQQVQIVHRLFLSQIP